ncbi:hypothetical protein C8R44DRAFT_865306 [Mycena epipterygia]|nr:hypothetical protein C8R44DRAFT_865306 [Mycena epipterygia]
MDLPSTPPRIQELLEQYVECFRDSESDLKACALVSRSWASAAQPHVSRDSPGDIARFPHLTRHIHRLELNADHLSTETFTVIRVFPFTNLVHVAIRLINDLDLPSATAMQQLLSVPTLRRAWISCILRDPSIFLPDSNLVLPPIRPDQLPRLRLQSLQIVFLKGVSHWITHPSCPLDLFALKALLISSNTALQTIEALDFIPDEIEPTIDLSSSPNLTLLRTGVSRGQALRSVSEILATIAPTNSIRKIIIISAVLLVWMQDWQQLDRILPTLPMHHVTVLGFQMQREGYDRLVPFLPRMSPRSLSVPIPLIMGGSWSALSMEWLRYTLQMTQRFIETM